MNGHGIVTALRGEKAQVRVTVDSGGGCPSCAARNQCHSGGNNGHEITVLNDYGAEVADRVAFEADSGKVILSAALIWMLPIFAMFIGYLAGTRFGGGFIPIAAALLFLAASYLLLRVTDRAVSGGRSFYPRIVAVLDDTSPPCEAGGRE
ncbi:MAG: SoxR reducing system RseC family protein [Candidatus Latescibacterota bacterium]